MKGIGIEGCHENGGREKWTDGHHSMKRNVSEVIGSESCHCVGPESSMLILAIKEKKKRVVSHDRRVG